MKDIDVVLLFPRSPSDIENERYLDVCLPVVACTIGVCRYCLLRRPNYDKYVCFSGTTFESYEDFGLTRCYCKRGFGMHASVALLKEAFPETTRSLFTVTNISVGSKGVGVLVHVKHHVLVACIRFGDEAQPAIESIVSVIGLLLEAEGDVPVLLVGDIVDENIRVLSVRLRCYHLVGERAWRSRASMLTTHPYAAFSYAFTLNALFDVAYARVCLDWGTPSGFSECEPAVENC
jgi:hypothetical protein